MLPSHVEIIYSISELNLLNYKQYLYNTKGVKTSPSGFDVKSSMVKVTLTHSRYTKIFAKFGLWDIFLYGKTSP